MKLFEGSRGRMVAAFFAVIVASFLSVPASGQASAPPADPSISPAGKPIENALVGGSKTTAAKHPWLVELTLNGHAHCGGALVHPRMVLTAVSCLWNSDFDMPWGNMGNLQAFTGRSRSQTGGEELAIDNWGGAEKYRSATGENDWALIGLISPSSRPVLKIAGPGERSLWKATRTVTLAGFGDNPIGGPANRPLKQTELQILRDSACGSAAFHGSVFRVASMICAGAVKGSAGACQSDRGFPLTVPVDGGGRRIVGVASPVGCAGPNKPTIFARVAVPRLSSPINALAAEIGQHLMFTGPEADTDLLGAGGKQVGCKAAGKSGRKAARQIAKLEVRLTKVTGKARKKTKKALKRTRKQQVRAKKSVKRLCN